MIGCNIIHSLSDLPYDREAFRKPVASYDPKQTIYMVNYDISKAASVLGLMKYIPMCQLQWIYWTTGNVEAGDHVASQGVSNRCSDIVGFGIKRGLGMYR